MPTDAVSGQMCRPLNASTAGTLRENVCMCKPSLGVVYSHLQTPVCWSVRNGTVWLQKMGGTDDQKKL